MPRIRTAHKFNERDRTGDVLTDEHVDFSSLLLSADVLRGLNSSGFERPSPIQLKAIPLGRCGLDLIAQAKSGTGKTCVFSVIALESILLDSNSTQVLALAPTREIAVQIKDVLSAIGSEMEKLGCHAFIGGISIEEDKKALKKPCHVAVGTPGRIKFLIENNLLKIESVRLFILDEADKLLDESFQEQINWIFSSLPPNKQMMAFSATYPAYLAKHLTRYMREPTFVRLNATDPTLQGIKQFYQPVPSHPLPHKTFQEKVSQLLKLLSRLSFHQCLVFSNYQIRAQSLCETLCSKGWPSVFIAGSQTQTQRLKAMEKLKQFKCRVLISTDLTSRGIDAEHVNVVVNMDIPRDSETYLHRIGRAGRFGTQGVAVTFVASGDEERLFKTMEQNIGVTIALLPDDISQSVYNCSSELTLTHPTASSVEVNILKGNSATAGTSETQDKKSVSEVSPTGEENCHEVLEEISELTTRSDKKDEQCLTEYESLPSQKLGPFEPAQRSHDSHIAQQNGDREARLNVQDCKSTELQDLGKVSNVEDEQSSLPKAVESESTSVNGDFLVKLQQWRIDGTTPGSSQEESGICHKNDRHGIEEYTMINLSGGSSLEDSCTHHTTNNTRGLDIICKNENVSQILTEMYRNKISALHDSTCISSGSTSSNSSCEETNSVHNVLPSAAEFDRDFSHYLQSAQSFPVGQESDFIDERKLPVPSDCANDLENQLCDTDSISHASSDLCHNGSDASHQCYCKKDDSVTLETHSQSTDVPFNQNQYSHENCRYEPLNWEQTANGNICRFNLPVEKTEKCSCFEFVSPSLWNWDSRLALSCYLHPFDDRYCQPYNFHGNHYEGLSIQNNRRTGGSGWSQKVHSERGCAAMPAQDSKDTGHENNGSNHEYQWNASWYHAYWRQTNFLRQYLCYAKSCRF